MDHGSGTYDRQIAVAAIQRARMTSRCLQHVNIAATSRVAVSYGLIR
ncbi:hypothetical protein SBC2_79310 (plasmid) [Caballeronia sp. SBC2]|nr:hypothetical protein SBC2_79310 [Caballeronia sp. SBC2]